MVTAVVFLTIVLGCTRKENQYFEDGNIKYEAELKNNRRNGKYTSYYKTGEVLEVRTYSNDTIDGWVHGYFKNGVLSHQGYFNKGIRIGYFPKYYNNGKQEHNVLYCNGEQCFYQKFDTLGNCISQDAKILFTSLASQVVSIGYLSKDDSFYEYIDSVGINDTIKLLIELAGSEYFGNVYYKIGLLTPTNNKVPLLPVADSNNKVKYTFVAKEIGNYGISVVAYINDSTFFIGGECKLNSV